MVVRRLLLVSMLAVLAFAGTPSRASADWFVTPFVGGNFGGNANFGGDAAFEDEFERRVDLGASLGWMGAGIAGFEVDWGWSPNFFQNTTGAGDLRGRRQQRDDVHGQPGPGRAGWWPDWRRRAAVRGRWCGPAAEQHLRQRRSSIDDFTSNDFGIDLGGGLHGYFNDHVGLRGDIRYFRLLQDNEPAAGDLDIGLADFNFWRATIGVTFRFGN